MAWQITFGSDLQAFASFPVGIEAKSLYKKQKTTTESKVKLRNLSLQSYTLRRPMQISSLKYSYIIMLLLAFLSLPLQFHVWKEHFIKQKGKALSAKNLKTTLFQLNW